MLGSYFPVSEKTQEGKLAMPVKIAGISRLPRVCHNFSLKVCVSSQMAICEGTLEIPLK